MRPETDTADDVLSRPIHVTVWRSMAPREAFGGPTTMRKLAEAIKARGAKSKEDLYWLKLGRFGTLANEKGYLRHNANLEEIEGLEGDYDAKKMTVEQAVEIAEKAGLACIIYTSPSHTPEEPKWRILAPFSRPIDPIERDVLMGQLNGLYAQHGAQFDPASWTLSQSYYYGYVFGNEAHHEVRVVEGHPIDEMHELERLWTPKPLREAKFADAEGHDHAYRSHASDVELDLEAVYAAIASGDNFHHAMLTLAASLFGKGYEREEVEAELNRVMAMVPADKRDTRWRRRASRGHINSILNWVGQQENRKLFRRIREKEARQEDAKTTPPPEDEPAEEQPKAKGRKDEDPKKTATNVLTLRRAMARYPDMNGLVAFDEFAMCVVLQKPIPDPDRGKANCWQPRPWEDADDIRLALWFQSIGYLKASTTLANNVVQIVAAENSFHPVRDYLDGLRHDGFDRLSGLLRCGFGVVGEDAAQADYHTAVSRAMLIGAVARIYSPGCKVDTMAILEGPQGALKSSGVRALVPNAEWFSDTMPSDLDHKDARQHLPGKWLVEMSEISQLRKSEVESLKSFLSTQVDRYRPSYGRVEVSRPRQSLFIGTTNEDAYLSDATGNRRFWPVKVGAVNLDWIKENREQLWAEAVKAFNAGERWWLADAAAEYALQAQQDRMASDEWESVVMEYAGSRSTGFRVGDVLKDALFLDTSMHGKVEQMRVSTILKKCGYVRKQEKRGGYPVWVWLKPKP